MTQEANMEEYLLKPDAALGYVNVAYGWKRKVPAQPSPMLWFEHKELRLVVSLMGMEAASGDIEISLSPTRKNGKPVRRKEIDRVRRDFFKEYENVKLRLPNPVLAASQTAPVIMAVTATDTVIEGPGEMI